MIEKVILDTLKVDSVLKGILTRYEHLPAIFSEFAPEKAVKPYITFEIQRTSSDHLSLHIFNVYIDIWGKETSRVNVRNASERIEYLFDNKQFSSSRYSSIRFWFFSGGWIEDEDPRIVRYNHQFTVRACRKKWIDQLT